MKKFDYETIDPGYYHKAMLHGSRIQRFWHTWKFAIAAQRIPKQKISVVDIGCGPGSFFYILRKRNREAVLFGTDLMLKQLEYAKTVEPRAHWFVSDATKMPLKAKSIDVAAMLEIIEHLPPEDEHQILEQVRKSLAKGGKIIITTPNYRSLWPILEWFWNIVSPVSYKHQHINRKTMPKLARSLHNAGFRVESIKTFFVLSPFFAFISPRFAEWLLRIEQKCLPGLGAVMIAEASA